LLFLNRFAVSQMQKACIEPLDGLSVFHANNQNLVHTLHVNIHLVRGLPIDGIGSACVKDDFEPTLIKMISNPKGRGFKRLVMNETELTARVDNKTYVHVMSLTLISEGLPQASLKNIEITPAVL
jgi:hypothetical protein